MNKVEEVKKLSNYMNANKHIDVLFTFIGEFPVPIDANQNNEYYIKTLTLEFTSYIYLYPNEKGDIEEFLHITDIYVDGKLQRNDGILRLKTKYNIKTNDIFDYLVTNGAASDRIACLGPWAGPFTNLGVFLIGLVLKLFF